MPVIPESPIAEPVSRPQISPQMAEEPFLAVAKAAEGMYQESQHWMAFGERMQRAQDHIDAMKIEKDMKGDYLKYQESLLLNNDYRSYDKNFQSFKDNFGKKYEEQTKGRPELQGIISEYGQGLINELHYHTAIRTVDLMQDETEAEVLQERKSVLQQMAATDNPDEREAIKTKFHAQLEALNLNNLVKGGETGIEKIMEGIDKDVAMTELAGLHSDKLPVINGLLDKIKKGYFEGKVDPEILSKLQVAGEDRKDRLEEKSQESMGDVIVNGIKERMPLHSPKDYDAALALLRQPGIVDKFGIKPVTHAREFIERERSEVERSGADEAYKRINKIIDEPNRVKQLQMLRDSKAFFDEVHPQLYSTAKKDIDSAMKEEAREQKSEEKDKSNEIFGEISSRIVKEGGVDVTKDIYGRLGKGEGKGLIWSDAQKLIKMNKMLFDPNFKLGVDVLNEAFNNKVIDAATRGEMLIDLSDEVISGELKGKDIIEAAKEMTKTKSQSWIGKMFDKLLGKGETSPTEGYSNWFKQLETTRGKQEPGYDLWGWYNKATPEQRQEMIDKPTEHFTDKFKTPEHLTFSTDSKFSKPGQEGGVWKEIRKGHWSFTPSKFNLNIHTPEEYRKVFAGEYGIERDDEGNITGRSELILPKSSGQSSSISEKKDKFGYIVGEVRTVKGIPYKYIGNDKWQPQQKQ